MDRSMFWKAGSIYPLISLFQLSCYRLETVGVLERVLPSSFLGKQLVAILSSDYFLLSCALKTLSGASFLALC